MVIRLHKSPDYTSLADHGVARIHCYTLALPLPWTFAYRGPPAPTGLSLQQEVYESDPPPRSFVERCLQCRQVAEPVALVRLDIAALGPFVPRRQEQVVKTIF